MIIWRGMIITKYTQVHVVIPIMGDIKITLQLYGCRVSRCLVFRLSLQWDLGSILSCDKRDPGWGDLLRPLRRMVMRLIRCVRELDNRLSPILVFGSLYHCYEEGNLNP